MQTPPTWPLAFTLVQRRIPDEVAQVHLATTVTYYDYQAGANLIVITPDANVSDVLWDLELNSHHSFYYVPARQSCHAMDFPVGILRPDWLANATSLGSRVVNGRLCYGWTKVDFIDYWADAETCQPVSWYFHTMQATFNTIYYAEGATAPAATYFVPPAYCNATAGGTTTR